MARILQALLPRLKPVLSKRVGVALGLWGEAGIGKTWTAGQLITQTPCKSFTLHATATLAAWVKTFPRPIKLPIWTMRVLERIERGEHLDSASVADALASLLVAMSPVMLYLEDLHEVSADRMELITLLAVRVVRTRGVALIVTSLTPPLEPFESVRLEPLSPEDSRQLIEGEVGTQLPGEGLDWIYTHALGNPLFSLEYLRYLTRTGYLWSDGQRWHWRTPPQDLMPQTIEALIEQMLLAISDKKLRAALEVRAILPAQTSEALWAEVAQLEVSELEQAKLGLLQQGILHGPFFAHPLIKEVTRKNLNPQQRQTLARRALEALRQDPEAAAWFVADAGLLPGQALEVLKQAAKSSRERGNEVQAARFLAQAVEYASSEQQPGLAIEAAQDLRDIDSSAAIRLAELAASFPAHRFQAVFLLAELLAQWGQGLEAEQCLDRLSQSERENLATLALRLRIKSSVGDDQGAVSLLNERPEIFQTTDADTLFRVGWSLVRVGQIKQAQELAETALAQPDLIPVSRAKLLKVTSLAAYYQGNYADMKQLEAEIYQLAAQAQNLRLMSTAVHNRALAAQFLEQYQEYLGCLEQGLELDHALGEGRSYAITQASYASMLCEMGRYEEAEDQLLEAHAVLERGHPDVHLVDCECSLADLYKAWRPLHGKLLALKYAHAALAHARQGGNPRSVVQALLYVTASETLAGKPSSSLAYAEEATRLAETLAEPYAQLQAKIALADAWAVQGHPEALLTYRQAEQQAHDLGATITEHLVGLEADHLAGDETQARERLKWFTQNGLLNGVNHVHRLFPKLAETPNLHHSQQLPVSSQRLEILGPLRFEGQAIRGGKRKELLAALLEAHLSGRSEAPMLELIESLYPEEPELEAQASLRNLVFSTRESLGQAVIVTTPAGYALGQVGSDAEEFLRSGDTHLWRGSYRSDAEGEADQGVWEALYHSLANQGAGLIESDPTEAARIGRILLEADPYNSEHLGLTLRALRASNNHKTLTRLYTQARERFAEVGQTLPQDWKTYLQKSA